MKSLHRVSILFCQIFQISGKMPWAVSVKIVLSLFLKCRPTLDKALLAIARLITGPPGVHRNRSDKMVPHQCGTLDGVGMHQHKALLMHGWTRIREKQEQFYIQDNLMVVLHLAATVLHYLHIQILMVQAVLHRGTGIRKCTQETIQRCGPSQVL